MPKINRLSASNPISLNTASNGNIRQYNTTAATITARQPNRPIIRPEPSIDSSDPELLKGVEPQRIQAWRRVRGTALLGYYDAMTAGKFQWSIGAYPTADWAKKVFPDKSEGDAIDALWNAIFTACRISGDGTAVAR